MKTMLKISILLNVLLLCGVIGLIGMAIFSRRELATAQGNQ